MVELEQFMDISELREFPDTQRMSIAEEYHEEVMERLDRLREGIEEKNEPSEYDEIALKVRIEIKDRAWSQIRALERGEKIQLKHWHLSATKIYSYLSSKTDDTKGQ